MFHGKAEAQSPEPRAQSGARLCRQAGQWIFLQGGKPLEKLSILTPWSPRNCKKKHFLARKM
jgi:hypothetical protein